ncbi:MAG TPA: dihydrolipoamide acetyltransferase family protein [Chitinophagaceae bacterium]|nr:dihydrolipoamide acetyltransferase family protein [Chitinophagaceae bacterium]
MAVVDLIMPKLGESIMEATILKWHKKPGDPVKMDETVLDIATDKVDSEVPSTASGIIEELLFRENDVVPIGAVIARIRSSSEQEASASVSPAAAPVATAGPDEASHSHHVAPAAQPVYSQPAAVSNTTGNNRFYSPLVLNIAASESVSMQELEQIPGTGNEGRVTKKDILTYISDRRSGRSRPAPQAAPVHETIYLQDKNQPATINAVPSLSVNEYGGNVEIIEMDRMRKLIAKHMVDSKHTSAHVTSFTEADVTNMVLWRERIKKDFEKRENEKITFTPLFIEAVVKCIKKYPWLNSSIDGDKLIVKKDINIGMATALPSGNLIVPVIRHADQLNLVGLTKQVNGLAQAARNNKLRPDDTQGGTFTLTNVGSFGSLMGTPIISQPQVAILAVGAIKKRPVVVETKEGDSIAIRHMMYLSMSYDHRIIDGALGATFLNAVAMELENFDGKREI